MSAENKELYEAAVNAVREANKAQISLLQRKLKINYNKAADLMIQLEKNKVVSVVASDGSRKVIQSTANKTVKPAKKKSTKKSTISQETKKPTPKAIVNKSPIKKTPKKKPVKKAALKKIIPKTPTGKDQYGLTLKEREFADLYRGGPDGIKGNAKRVYMKTHPNCAESTAESKGAKTVGKCQIMAYLTLKADKLEKETDINAAWVLNRLQAELDADIKDIYDEKGGLKPIAEWPLIWRQGLISGIETEQQFEYVDGEKKPDGFVMKIKQSNRVKQLELAGKHVAVQAFRERLVISDDESRAERLARARLGRKK